MQGAKQLTDRILGESLASNFILIEQKSLNKNEYFEIEAVNSKIQITASSLTAMTSGIYHYIKHYLNISITWCNMDVQDEIRLPLPIPQEKVYKETEYTYKYYLNYCTYGYSMAFWEWERWERELDWIALNGINIVLSLVGHEEVYRRSLMEIGYTNEEAKSFVCGPAFMPWQWMQNIEGWASNHTDEWFERRVALAKKIHQRMKELGITPAMQGYSGMIPTSFKEKNNCKNTLVQGKWCELQRPDMIIPTTDTFDEFAEIFYRNQREIFGVDSHFYCTDPFHEGGNKSGLELKKCIKNMQQAMIKQDKDAIWIVQGWGENPDETALEVLDKNHTLILDLWCESRPTWKSKDGFKGIPWLWCILGNFGGKNGMYGNLEVTANGHRQAFNDEKSKQMLGVGMTMEGINNNPVIWEILTDSSYGTQHIDVQKWLEGYITRRYKKLTDNAIKCWEILSKSVYNCEVEQEGSIESIFCARPNMEIQSVSNWGPKQSYYDTDDIIKASKLIFADYEQLKEAKGYLYDLIDITRQAFADIGKIQYKKWVDAFRVNDLALFKKESAIFLEMVLDMDRLLATNESFLLGPYLNESRSIGVTNEEKDYLEYNARTIITVWANEQGSVSLRDYSHRQWAGITKDLYAKRWEMYFDAIAKAMEQNKKIEEIDWYAIEYKWAKSTNKYDDKVTGETGEIITEIYKKYFV